MMNLLVVMTALLVTLVVTANAEGAIEPQAGCECEADMGDSCGLTGCCPPLTCQRGKCLPPCLPNGSPCGLGQCCSFQGEACQFNPTNQQALCLKCIRPFDVCNPAVPAHFIGSCCFGFTCQNFACLPAPAPAP